MVKREGGEFAPPPLPPPLENFDIFFKNVKNVRRVFDVFSNYVKNVHNVTTLEKCAKNDFYFEFVKNVHLRLAPWTA